MHLPLFAKRIWTMALDGIVNVDGGSHRHYILCFKHLYTARIYT